MRRHGGNLKAYKEVEVAHLEKQPTVWFHYMAKGKTVETVKSWVVARLWRVERDECVEHGGFLGQ